MLISVEKVVLSFGDFTFPNFLTTYLSNSSVGVISVSLISIMLTWRDYGSETVAGL